MTVTTSHLAYYASHSCALFPIPAGSKNPTGIVASFAHDCSTDPAQWSKWYAEHRCNFGVVAGPSRLIIVDVDVSELGRDRAWALWCAWCAERGFMPPQPHINSARGGWHTYFSVPADAPPLRQRPLVGPTDGATKNIVETRAGNGFTVAAGSHFESLPYVLLSDAPPYPAPAALLTHCARSSKPAATSPAIGNRDPAEVAALLAWLNERGEFDSYDAWTQIGMALKIEFGDAGFDLWETITWPDALSVAADKWESFASEPTADCVTLNTFIQRASHAGFRGKVGASAQSMFADAVAVIAANAGASLPAPMPMVGAQQKQCEIGEPILNEFLDATSDAPFNPAMSNPPTLPESVAHHGLYGPMRQAISRLLAMAETPKLWKPQRVTRVLALLRSVHEETYTAVVGRIETLGRSVIKKDINHAREAIDEQIERAFVDQGKWVCDVKGQIENDNSDNVAVFLGVIGCEVRWNAWLDRAEIKGYRWPDWTYLDDPVFAILRTRANRTKTRFRPGKDFLWESLFAMADDNTYDPARDMLDSLASQWDGVPRLTTWLHKVCEVECDIYHQAVSRLIIAGLVARIRNPGCKFDFMPVFYGPQGTGKSTMAKLLALCDAWFSDEIMLGDASKELVLSLAGKAVVEISEMGMRGSSNPAHVKAMLSRQTDRGRAAYARSVSERPRRNIFIGTTNDSEPLSDPTGNRRFLPVKCERKLNTDWLRENIGQIVGEAARMNIPATMPESVWGRAAERQEEARAETDVEVLLSYWFAERDSTAPYRWHFVTTADIAQLAGIAGWRNTHGREVALQRLGFRKVRVHLDGGRPYVWVRGPEGLPKWIGKEGLRYVVGADASGRPRVTISAPES